MIDVISTDKAPKAIGPYSQAISCHPSTLIFISGQIPLDPQRMTVVDGGIRAQTTQVLKNIQAILEQSSCSFKDVVKTTIFLKDMNDFAAVNEVYGAVFTNKQPARSTVEVARLPRDVLIEIEVIAAKK